MNLNRTNFKFFFKHVNQRVLYSIKWYNLEKIKLNVAFIEMINKVSKCLRASNKCDIIDIINILVNQMDDE